MSAYENAVTAISLPAESDLSASQYCFVTVNSNGRVALTNTGTASDGVLQNKPSAQGQAAAVGISGVSKVTAGAAINAGAFVAVGSSGRAVPVTSGAKVVGRALAAASGAGAIIPCILIRSV